VFTDTDTDRDLSGIAVVMDLRFNRQAGLPGQFYFALTAFLMAILDS